MDWSAKFIDRSTLPALIAIEDDGCACTQPVGIDHDQCESCQRPLRSGPAIVPATMLVNLGLISHNRALIVRECISRIALSDKPAPLFDDPTDLEAVGPMGGTTLWGCGP